MFTEKDPLNFACLRWLGQYMAGHNGFIAGGCFKQIFTGEKIKDIDIFFENERDFKKACNYFKESSEFSNYYTNDKVVAFTNNNNRIVVELIRAVYGTPTEIISNFDFTITKFAYAKREIESDGFEERGFEYYILCHDLFFEHLQQKRLVIDDKALYPVGTFERMFRYSKYGYFPCSETKLKIIEELKKITTVTLSKDLYEGVD